MNYIVIGNSAAGIGGVEAIRNTDHNSKITVISEEDYPAYCRCLLPLYLSGEVNEEKLLYRPVDFHQMNNTELLLGRKVERIEPVKNRIVLEDKSRIGYDVLLLATGSSPKFPQIRGISKSGVFGFRTIKDTKEIIAISKGANHACVLGGGLIGLKAAYGLKKRGLEVKVIVRSNMVLSQMLDEQSAKLFMNRFQANGIEIMTGLGASEILGNGEVKALRLTSGKVLACEVVIVGKGVEPNTKLISQTEIKKGKGVLVDEYMRTNLPNIYAAGDVCETLDITLGKMRVNALWPHAVEQGRVAGTNMAKGAKLKYDGSLGMNSVEFFELAAISMGITKVEEEGYQEEIREEKAKGVYKKIVLKDNRLVGMILIGKVENAGVIGTLIRNKVDISSIKHLILDDDFGYGKILPLIKKDKERFGKEEFRETILTY